MDVKPIHFNMKITVDNRELIKKATDEQIKTALEAVGAQAASFAAKEATAKGVVDTGLLRNSLTFALGGKTANTRTYHAAYGSNKYTSKGVTKRRGANSKKAGTVKVGRYEGTAPNDTMFDRKVYIGTNVEYAIYQELGFHDRGGGWHAGRPFLRPAIEGHASEFQRIIESYLKRVVGK